MTTTATRIDARTAAYLIANRLAQAGYTEDGIIPAMAADRLPALEVLIDGRRFLITVEPVPEQYQPVTVEEGDERGEPYDGYREMNPADVQWLLAKEGRIMADGAVQGVLF